MKFTVALKHLFRQDFKLIFYRLVNWGAFSGMFMTIFIYSSSVTSETCSMNPNYCTILFRSVLWFTVVVALAVIKSDRRGGRIDWAVAVILSIGISLLLWNHSVFIYLFSCPFSSFVKFNAVILHSFILMYSLFSYFF